VDLSLRFSLSLGLFLSSGGQEENPMVVLSRSLTLFTSLGLSLSLSLSLDTTLEICPLLHESYQQSQSSL
jgi:hypothetical protein